jgi:glycosyltransferase involved in cell wall biosynthesis
MKIGFVTGEYPPMEGGVGAFTRELAKEFGRTGNEVHVITSRRARPKIEGRSLWDIREPYDVGYAELHAGVGRWWWPAMSTVANIVSRYDLDIVNIQYQAAAFDMKVPAINFLPWRLRGMTKTVVTFHDLRVPYLFPKAGRLRAKMVRKLAHSADGIIVTNNEDYERLRETGPGASAIVQLPIGSNIKASVPDPERVESLKRSIVGNTGSILLGYFGFLNETKGANLLVESFATLPEQFELIFIGGQTGSSDSARNQAFLSRLKERIHELRIQDRIHWSGFLDDEDVSTYLYACDMMVMPYRDGASLRRGTLMAALAHGCPIITTRPNTRVGQLIHGENVWMTPVDDSRELSDAIVTLGEDADLRQKLGEFAKQSSIQFNWDVIAAQTEAFFEEIIASEI